jgi:protein-S-isoprenylcysteine O-methyltransferase Ste14
LHPRRGVAFVVAQLVLFGLIAVAPVAARSAWPLAVRGFGAVIGLAGLVLCVLAIRSLGAAMTPRPEPRPGAAVATSGPYRFVRHPIYTGVVALGIGYSVTRSSWLALVFAAALALLFDGKARYEERLLVSRPGYTTYATTTRRRFVPGLY